MLRFHTQTAGVQLTAQQPEVNLVRVTVQALAAVLGGTQSLHTNSFDEAIALPTQKSARLALRTQQVLAYETDITATVDPFAGSYVVESLTDDLETEIERLMGEVADRGGAVAAIEEGYQKGEIERSAYDVTRGVDAGERVVVGVNRYQLAEEEPYEPLRVDPAIEAAQTDRLATCGPSGTVPTWRPRWRRSGRRPPAPPTCWCRCGRRWRPGPRWVRCATLFATCGGPTSRRSGSDGSRRRTGARGS